MSHPVIENAPGLAWRMQKAGWACRWRARADLIRRGYEPLEMRLWAATKECPEPTEMDKLWISERATILQNEMLAFGRGGIAPMVGFDGTIKSLCACYQSDPDSPYKEKRFASREGYDGQLDRIQRSTWVDETRTENKVRVIGDVRIAEIDARMVKRWHESWLGQNEKKKVAMAHSLIQMLRGILTFGSTFLKDKDCREARLLLKDMRFANSSSRKSRLTADQAIAVRKQAHEANLPSIALAQAFQFELMLRQKDVIGEWVPIDERGPPTDIVIGQQKWWRGLDWKEIDAEFRFSHNTSKRSKELELPDLREAPMVMEELRRFAEIGPVETLRREHLPANGPIIINARYGVPWTADAYRYEWRKLATKASVPKNVFNMDSRAGGVSEATDAGAPIELVRHAATHSDIATTQGYSRGSAEKVGEVLRMRVAHRNRTGTK